MRYMKAADVLPPDLLAQVFHARPSKAMTAA